MRKPDDTETGRSLQSGRHVLHVVRLVAERGVITVREIAAELDVGASTAHRLLATCLEAGFVRQTRRNGPYAVGPAMHEIALAGTAAVGLQSAADGILRSLRTELGETVSLLVLEGRHARFVESFEGQQHAVRVTPRIGITLPAHCTAGGKAMLACLPPDEVRRRLSGPLLEVVTERSICTLEELTRELDQVRRRGWAYTLAESDTAIAAVGAAVRSGTGEPRAAVNVSAPVSRLSTSGEIGVLAPAVVDAAARIQRRLRGAEGS